MDINLVTGALGPSQAILEHDPRHADGVEVLGNIVSLMVDRQDPVPAPGADHDRRARGLVPRWQVDRQRRVVDPRDVTVVNPVLPPLLHHFRIRLPLRARRPPARAGSPSAPRPPGTTTATSSPRPRASSTVSSLFSAFVGIGRMSLARPRRAMGAGGHASSVRPAACRALLHHSDRIVRFDPLRNSTASCRRPLRRR